MITIYPDPKDAAITGIQTDVSGLTTDLATLTADVAVIDANVDAIKADTDAYLDAAISSITPGKSKAQAFTSSGTFTPDSGVTGGWVTIVGAGGGGGGSGSALGEYGGAGGGSGQAIIRWPVVFSGAVTVTIGAAGGGGAAQTSGSTGGATSFGSLSVYGGVGGAGATTTAVVSRSEENTSEL